MTRRDRVGGEVECYFQIMELARNLELGIRAHYNNFSNRHLCTPTVETDPLIKQGQLQPAGQL